MAGTLAASGAASRLLELWRDGEFEIVACPRLVQEIGDALLRPRIASRYGITPDEVNELGHRIEEEAIWVSDPVDPTRIVPQDPGDDYLIALALENDADALVRRDRHFDGVSVTGLRILHPGQLLEELTG